MLLAFLTSLVVVGVIVWTDGLNDSNDGRRYTSGLPQPAPFHRRFCGWNKKVLTCLTLLSMVALGTLMGGWQKALLLLTLPGAWMILVHPTTVDGPCVLLAWLAAQLLPTCPWCAVALSLLGGFLHERTPVLATAFAISTGWLSLLLLAGMLAAGWWRTAAKMDGDQFVGHGFVDQVRAHRPYVDLLDWRSAVFGSRMVPVLAAFYGLSWTAWVAFALSHATRVIGTDHARFVFWGCVPLIAALPPSTATWAVAIHVMSFRRMI